MNSDNPPPQKKKIGDELQYREKYVRDSPARLKSSEMKRKYEKLPELQVQLKLLANHHKQKNKLMYKLDLLNEMIEILKREHIFSRQDVADRFAQIRSWFDALLVEFEESVTIDIQQFKRNIDADLKTLREDVKHVLTHITNYMNSIGDGVKILNTKFNNYTVAQSTCITRINTIESESTILKLKISLLEYDLAETRSKNSELEERLERLENRNPHCT